MITIYKYPVSPSNEPNVIQMPQGASIISCGVDGFGGRSIWAFVDTDKPTEKRKIWCVGTGWNLEDMLNNTCISYLGTIKDNYYIWHIFEEVDEEARS